MHRPSDEVLYAGDAFFGEMERVRPKKGKAPFLFCKLREISFKKIFSPRLTKYEKYGKICLAVNEFYHEGSGFTSEKKI